MRIFLVATVMVILDWLNVPVPKSGGTFIMILFIVGMIFAIVQDIKELLRSGE